MYGFIAESRGNDMVDAGTIFRGCFDSVQKVPSLEPIFRAEEEFRLA